MKHLIVLLIWAAVASAHSGDRVFPFYELTDEMLENIDLHDGLIDEWYEIGEPSMTLLDFKTVQDFIPADPSNLDFRIWLAWHDESNRIFAAFIVSDEEYKNTHDRSGTGTQIFFDSNDSITLLLDADHSGGMGTRNETTREEYPLFWGRTQKYYAISQTASGPTIEAAGHRFLGQPTHFVPPYTDAGGGVAGENPVIWIIELYVTPQDAWGDNIEDTPFSELSAHQIIGFAPIIYDVDPSDKVLGSASIPWHPEGIDDEAALNYLDLGEADIFLDGVLLPAQDTAVESVTWGRIKASLK